MNRWDALEKDSREILFDRRVAGWVEGYAAACADIMFKLTGDSPCGKSYDPLVVEESSAVMLSYAFDMKDGGRCHPIIDYKDVQEIVDYLLKETIEWVNNENN